MKKSNNNSLSLESLVASKKPVTFKSIAYLCLKLFLVILLCAICGIAALTAAYSIPTTRINENISQSAELLEKEGLYPSVYTGVSSQLDNFTDSLMLHTAGYELTESPLEEAALINRLECVDYHHALDSLLADVYNTGREFDDISYCRYWHGYLSFLKPMLTMFNYGQIRTINTVIQYGLVILLFALLIKRKLYLYTIPTVLLLGFQGMTVTGMSLQYSNVFYVYIIGMILLLLFYDRWKESSGMLIYFTVLGVMTAYMDLLTYPLVTFGVPVALLLVLEGKRTFFQQIKTIVICGITWVIGFAGMWLGKGVLGSLITRKNIFTDMFGAVKDRSVGFREDITLFSALSRNVISFVKSYFSVFAVLFCIVFLVLIICRICKTKKIFDTVNNLGFLLIAVSPLCWYLVLKQHSHIHHWFTYREFLITVFAFSVMLVKMFLDTFPKSSKNDTTKNAE